MAEITGSDYYVDKIKSMNTRNIKASLKVNGIEYSDILALTELTEKGMQQYQMSLDRHILEVVEDNNSIVTLEVPSFRCSEFMFFLLKHIKNGDIHTTFNKDILYYSNSFFVKDINNVYRYIMGELIMHKMNDETTGIIYKYDLYLMEHLNELYLNVYMIKPQTGVKSYNGKYDINLDMARKLIGLSNSDIINYLISFDLEYRDVVNTLINA